MASLVTSLAENVSRFPITEAGDEQKTQKGLEHDGPIQPPSFELKETDEAFPFSERMNSSHPCRTHRVATVKTLREFASSGPPVN